MKNKAHLTQEGFYEICSIKGRMNTGRNHKNISKKDSLSSINSDFNYAPALDSELTKTSQDIDTDSKTRR
jgi:hypothetical protein